MHTGNFRKSKSAEGFSLLELLLVAGLIGVIGAISTGSLNSFIKSSRADSGMETALNALRLARDQAISERRNFALTFVEPNEIHITRKEIPSGSTPVSVTYLTGNLIFLQVDDAGDTPDTFGDDDAIDFGTSPERMFTSEGTFVNSSGDPLNGTIFMAVEGDPLSARAITILGATALLHTWKWNGSQWID